VNCVYQDWLNRLESESAGWMSPLAGHNLQNVQYDTGSSAAPSTSIVKTRIQPISLKSYS